MNNISVMIKKKPGDGLCSGGADQGIIANNVARDDRRAGKNLNNA